MKNKLFIFAIVAAFVLSAVIPMFVSQQAAAQQQTDGGGAPVTVISTQGTLGASGQYAQATGNFIRVVEGTPTPTPSPSPTPTCQPVPGSPGGTIYFGTYTLSNNEAGDFTLFVQNGNNQAVGSAAPEDFPENPVLIEQGTATVALQINVAAGTGTGTISFTSGGAQVTGNIVIDEKITIPPTNPVTCGTPTPTPTPTVTPTPTATPTPTVTPTPTPTPTACRIQQRSDFTGDGKSDFSVFRPSTGTWFVQPNDAGSASGTRFGTATDKLQPTDYDGDGITDFAVYRDGFWYIVRSSNNAVAGYQFGTSADIPVAADYTGDGKADLAVYRPSTGVWYFLRSETNSAYGIRWGGEASDLPIVGDFDGDCRMDLAVRRTTNETDAGGTKYFILGSTIGATSVRWGRDDMPMAIGDYDGDGKSDVGVIETRNGLYLWYVIQAVGNSVIVNGTAFGQTGDVVTAADYDGDRRTDLSVFRHSNGVFYHRSVQNETQFGRQFGTAGDVPTARWSQYPLP